MRNALANLYKLVLAPGELENDDYQPTTGQLWAFVLTIVAFLLIGSYLTV